MPGFTLLREGLHDLKAALTSCRHFARTAEIFAAWRQLATGSALPHGHCTPGPGFLRAFPVYLHSPSQMQQTLCTPRQQPWGRVRYCEVSICTHIHQSDLAFVVGHTLSPAPRHISSSAYARAPCPLARKQLDRSLKPVRTFATGASRRRLSLWLCLCHLSLQAFSTAYTFGSGCACVI